MKFNELNLSKQTLQALKKRGFVKASKIQEKVIPDALLGKDIVGKSKTGTGKTLAFALPLIEKIIPRQAFSSLIVVPTRELAKQVKDEIVSVSGNKIRALAVFGGQKIIVQMNLLRRRPEIIVGTPGRLIDLVSRGALNFNKANFLVLDEADKMFEMGFKEDVEKIINFLPKKRQTMLFSATMSRDIKKVMNKYLNKEKSVFDLSEDNASVQEVEQFYVKVHEKKKLDSLLKLLKHSNSKFLVFCRTKRTVDWLSKMLSKKGIRNFSIHGDKTQNFRMKSIEKFKKTRNSILIATDIVSRGIHVDDIETVINFDFPQGIDAYLHRIGRTARQGRTGKAISFCVNSMQVNYIEEVCQRNNALVQQLK